MKWDISTGDSLEEISKKFQIPPYLLEDSNQRFALGSDKINIPGWIKTNNDFEKVTNDVINTKKPYCYHELKNDLNYLCEVFPFIRKEVIGYSVLGLPLYELKIGRGKKKVHMNASFHANEWITTCIMMKWLQDYLLAIINQQSFHSYQVEDLYKEVTLSIVPMVNPDGVNLVINKKLIPIQNLQYVLKLNRNNEDFSEWKANIRGVDLNNQYPANWIIEKERKVPKSPAPRDYPGDFYLTEPESIVMEQLVRRSDFDVVVAFHTQGEEIYWGYEGFEPILSYQIVKEFEKVSGYKPVQYIDSHAGFRDWFIYTYRKPGFTVELGLGENPLPLSEFDSIYCKSKGLFWSSLFMCL
ncbi:M14 family metallocarboxypeptidase [Bacillus carboniphilus]|uniref:M14 family metallocarboxypeptidase n=1 Tax=Bacillus carboniphilus TaxID=86663 RepID=A0ABY9K1Z2_9BACI|nr:M14 family metallocarboxypeptidase [Bacillus carboniphilus]WLR43936.1 M14 family metallocarboxypeptidase [Bacillus carboniphilus]